MNSCSGMGQLIALRSPTLFVFLCAEFCLDQVHNGRNFLLGGDCKENFTPKVDDRVL